jgi:histidine triad (HIT) family protein
MECVFCKIARKEIKSEIVYEDENFLAFLDIHPRSKGMSLVIPKKHVKSFEEDENLSREMFFIAVKIAESIKKALSPLAISIAHMPSQIEHLHLRIYPYFENEIPLIENKPIEIKPEELENIAETIRKNIRMDKIEEKEEVKEEEKEEKQKSDEKIFWLKRDWLIA